MKPHVLITLAILGVCLAVLYGCAGISHTFGLATTDDVRAERDDQRAIDKKIADVEKRAFMYVVNAIADVLEGKSTVPDMVNSVTAYLSHDELAPVFDAAVARTYARTAPPPPPTPSSPTDWPAIGIGIASGVIAMLAHLKSSATQKSLAQTDDWVQQTEDKVHANTVTTAMTAARVGVVPVEPVPAQPVQHPST